MPNVTGKPLERQLKNIGSSIFFLKIVFIKFCKRLVMGAFFARSAACEWPMFSVGNFALGYLSRPFG